MALRVVTPATTYPVTLADAKAHLRIESDMTDDDGLIDGLIAAATAFCENVTQRRFCTQTLEWVRNYWPDKIRFPVAPVQSVASITYTACDGTSQVLDPSLYIVRTSGQTKEIIAAATYFYGLGDIAFAPGPLIPWPWPLLGPSSEPIVIRFTAGYGSGDAGNADQDDEKDATDEDVDPVPAGVKHAIKLLVGLWYDSREAALPGNMIEPPYAVAALLESEKWY